MGINTKKCSIAAAIAFAISGNAWADASSKNETIEKIQVTGSKIKRTDLEGVAPLSVIDAAEIEANGFSSIADVLESSLANTGASFNGDEASGYTTGASSVNLRGMGANRTLVLINGRRQAAFPTAAGGADNFVDVSDIPTSAVERVEILTGGASAIYGSDAIGGVVNVILKDNYEGSKVSLKFENPTNGGRDVAKFSYTQGFETDKSNTVVIFEYQQGEELLTSQRQDYFAKGLNRIYNTDGYIPNDAWLDDDGNLLPWAQQWDWGGAAPSTWGVYIRDYDEVFGDKYPVTQEQCNNVLGDLAVWYEESSYTCRYDKYPGRGLESAYDRANLIINSEYELNNDWSLYGMINASYKDSDKYKDKKGNTSYFYLDNTTGDYSYDKPTSGDYHRFQLRRRYDELFDLPHSRIYTSTNEKYSFVFGANGTIGDYDLDVSWSTGFNRYNRDSQSQLSRDGLLSIITFDPNDADSSKWYPAERMTDAQAAAAYGVSTKRSTSRIHQLTSTLSGDLFELPSGGVAFAASAEWARESYNDILDETTQSGGFLGMGGTGGQGERDRYAGALEILAPIASDMPGIYNLELSVAGRYDYYNDDTDVGGAFSPQVGVMYHPVEDVLVRASWGKSFRAPDMHRVYAGTTIGFGTTEYLLPDGTLQEDSYRSISSGSLTLEEEKGEYSSIGLVANLTDELDFTLDWWSIEMTGGVRTIATDDIYNGPTDFSPAYNYTGQYNECTALPGPGFILGVDDEGFENLDCMKKAPYNAAFEKSEGVDASISYRLDADELGSFRFKFGASYLRSKKVQDKPELEVEDYVDIYYYPTWKSNSSITWSKDEFSTTIAYYYTGTSTGLDTFYEAVDGEMEKVSEQQMDKLSPYARLNWSASYRFDWDGKVKVGVKNLTDEMPPYYSVFNGDFDSHPFHRTSRGYSTIGRTVYIGYDQSF